MLQIWCTFVHIFARSQARKLQVSGLESRLDQLKSWLEQLYLQYSDAAVADHLGPRPLPDVSRL
jgi:hypothetical protein